MYLGVFRALTKHLFTNRIEKWDALSLPTASLNIQIDGELTGWIERVGRVGCGLEYLLLGSLHYSHVLSNRKIKYENSVALQEALEPYYIHQIDGKQADNDVVIQSVIGNGNR